MDYGTPPNWAELETHRLIGLGVPAEAAFPLEPQKQENDDE